MWSPFDFIALAVGSIGEKKCSWQGPWQAESDIAEAILNRMQASKFGNLFVVTAPSRSVVTFQSQQNRALNLIWALQKKTNLIGLGRSVAVVGGGLAGMTAALAAARLGCRTVLFERNPELMHLQRGSELRYIHPFIHKWPHESAGVFNTKLPLLNWGASSAGEVAEMIRWQWYGLGGVEERLGTVVTKISSTAESVLVDYQGKFTGQDQFKLVIISVGFGLESDFPPIEAVSYWNNDNFGRPDVAPSSMVASRPAVRKFFISGCGDGGLTDAVRLSLADFDQVSFTRFLLKNIRPPLTDELMEIESEAREQKTREAQSRFLSERYDLLHVDPLLANINPALRKNRRIYLNGSAPTPYSLSSSSFNRFACHLIFRSEARIKYVQGDLKKVSLKPKGTKVHVRQGVCTSVLNVDEVIIRHGCDGVLEHLIEGGALQRLASFSRDETDVLADPCFPPNFLESPQLSEMKERVLLRRAADNLGDLYRNSGIREILDGGIRLSVQQGAVRYNIYTYQRDIPRIEEFEDVKVEYESPRSGMSSHIITSTVLRPGVELGFHGACGKNNRASLLGCFAQSASGPVILTVAAGNVEVGDTVSHPEFNGTAVGRVVDQRSAIPITALAAPFSMSNDFAATSVLLETSMPFDCNIFDGKDRPKLVSTPEPATLGTQVGMMARGGYVYGGVISDTDAFVEIDLGGPCWFRNVFAIEPADGSFGTGRELGSLIFTPTGVPIGLFLGTTGTRGIGISLKRVLDELKLSFWVPNEQLD